MTDIKKPSKHFKNISKMTIIVFIIAIIYFIIDQEFLSLENIKSNFSNIKDYYINYPRQTILVYFVAYVFIAALSIPGVSALTILGGALFGLWKGTILVSFAATLGSTTAFLIARYFFKNYFQKQYSEKLTNFNDNIQKYGASYLFFLRLNPIFPFFLINSIMGLTTMKLWTFFYISLIGMLPGTILYINAGTQIRKIQSLTEIVSGNIIISFLLIGLFPLLTQILIRKIKKLD